VEREEISRGLAAGWSARRVAAGLGRSSSTVSREIARNGGRDGYRAARADRRAWDRACRPKRCLLSVDVRLRDAVAEKLSERWSPEQISGWLAVEYPQDETMRVSAETIYKTLFVQSRGALKKELVGQLRRRKSIRRSKQATSAGNLRCPIPDLVSISQRPAEADDRAVPGHWEGDLLEGSRGTQIATLVERHSRFVMLIKTDKKDTNTVVTALSEHVQRLPTELRRSLAWDRGSELADHHRFTLATSVQVYFCDPKSPWQRGSNENTNGLLRQYFPKGTNLAQHDQATLDYVANQLNTRPRKTLGYHTPAYTLDKALSDATTG
jgi:IS30 family transposase